MLFYSLKKGMKHVMRANTASDWFALAALKCFTEWVGLCAKKAELMWHKHVMDMDVKFSIGVPVSAACEQLFSVVKDVLSAKRNWLSDKNFERLLMCHVNKRFCPGI